MDTASAKYSTMNSGKSMALDMLALLILVLLFFIFPNCSRHTVNKCIFNGLQFVVIASKLYSCDLWSEYDKQASRYIGDGNQKSL